MNDVEHRHSFSLGDTKVVLLITRHNGKWHSVVESGETLMKSMQGGRYENLEEYIAACEKYHTQCHKLTLKREKRKKTGFTAYGSIKKIRSDKNI